MKIKYPKIKVKLTSNDGNAFFIMGTVQRALRKNKIPQEEINKYLEECKSGDYDHLLQTTMQWVDVS